MTRPVAPPPTNILLGIGNPRHGDDALGPVFARAFRHPGWLSLNAQTVPENYTGLIRRHRPGLLVILDAADMNLPPGTLRRLDPDAITGGDFGTHAGSIGLLANYLAPDVATIHILGIQPLQTQPGSPLSAPVRHTLRNLLRARPQIIVGIPRL